MDINIARQQANYAGELRAFATRDRRAAAAVGYGSDAAVSAERQARDIDAAIVRAGWDPDKLRGETLAGYTVETVAVRPARSWWIADIAAVEGSGRTVYSRVDSSRRELARDIRAQFAQYTIAPAAAETLAGLDLLD